MIATSAVAAAMLYTLPMVDNQDHHHSQTDKRQNCTAAGHAHTVSPSAATVYLCLDCALLPCFVQLLCNVHTTAENAVDARSEGYVTCNCRKPAGIARHTHVIESPQAPTLRGYSKPVVSIPVRAEPLLELHKGLFWIQLQLVSSRQIT